MIQNDKKQQIVKEFQKHDKDSGSEEVQVAILTEDIKELTGHAQKNPKDHSSKRGLLQKVSRRRKLLNYIQRKSEEAYKDIIKRLNIRK
ncbi:MAG: 30S ribosomal protein S15 [Candidatus Babeliales bacterium]